MTQPIDVVQIARKHTFLTGGELISLTYSELELFVCDILERAAIECEQSEAYRGSVFAQRIRALKPVLEKDNT